MTQQKPTWRAHITRCAEPLSMEIRERLQPWCASLSDGETTQGEPLDILCHALRTQRDGPDVAREVYALVTLLEATRKETGRYPKRVIVHHTGGSRNQLTLSLARTLVTYLTAHTVDDDVRINIVHAPNGDPQTLKSASNVAVALAAGWLDAMRGQVLSVQEGGTPQ